MFKVATTVASAAIIAAGTFFHAGFKSSMPARNTTVASPAVISVTFTEAIMAPPVSSFTLLNADSSVAQKLTVTLNAADKTTMEAKVVKPLAAGKYIVKWKNGAADDGHPLRGAFAFTVK